jgi:acetylornithine deacetylase/succinyl-diaminopimelate desuccinylase-like protein
MDDAINNTATDLRIDGGAPVGFPDGRWRRSAPPQKGGVKRLALTDLDKQGRDLVVSWGQEAGLTVTVDKIGNVFMRREGTNPALPPIVSGSHIDTQPTGGKFDGNYGVLAALEVVRTLNDRNIKTEAPIEVAFWTNEEGSRFVPVMMGSGVFCGAFSLEHAYAAKDTEGKSRSATNSRASATSATRAGRASDRRLFRGAHRAGPGAGRRGQGDRRGARGAGPVLVRLRGDGHGSARGPDADGAAPRCAAGGDHDHAGGGGDREPLPALRPRHGRHGAGASRTAAT